MKNIICCSRLGPLSQIACFGFGDPRLMILLQTFMDIFRAGDMEEARENIMATNTVCLSNFLERGIMVAVMAKVRKAQSSKKYDNEIFISRMPKIELPSSTISSTIVDEDADWVEVRTWTEVWGVVQEKHTHESNS